MSDGLGVGRSSRGSTRSDGWYGASGRASVTRRSAVGRPRACPAAHRRRRLRPPERQWARRAGSAPAQRSLRRCHYKTRQLSRVRRGPSTRDPSHPSRSPSPQSGPPCSPSGPRQVDREHGLWLAGTCARRASAAAKAALLQLTGGAARTATRFRSACCPSMSRTQPESALAVSDPRRGAVSFQAAKRSAVSHRPRLTFVTCERRRRRAPVRSPRSRPTWW